MQMTSQLKVRKQLTLTAHNELTTVNVHDPVIRFCWRGSLFLAIKHQNGEPHESRWYERIQRSSTDFHKFYSSVTLILCKKLHFSLKWQLLTFSLRICILLEIPRNTATRGQDSVLHTKTWSASHTHLPSSLCPPPCPGTVWATAETAATWDQSQPVLCRKCTRVSLKYHNSCISSLQPMWVFIPPNVCHTHWNSVVWCGKVIRVILQDSKNLTEVTMWIFLYRKYLQNKAENSSKKIRIILYTGRRMIPSRWLLLLLTDEY